MNWRIVTRFFPAQLSGLQILREISARIPASIVVNVDNLTIATDITVVGRPRHTMTCRN